MLQITSAPALAVSTAFIGTQISSQMLIPIFTPFIATTVGWLPGQSIVSRQTLRNSVALFR